jgi:hypothetical protein
MFFLLLFFSIYNSIAATPVIVPSYAPTAIPTPIVEISPIENPIAKHRLIVVQPKGNVLIPLTFYDASTTNVNDLLLYCFHGFIII